MPNIQEYTAPNDSINTEAFQVGARRIGAFANQTAEDIRRAGLLQAQDISSTIKDVGEAALQHVEYADAGRTNAQTTAFLANTDQQWEDAKKNATPEQLADPNWVKDFQKNVVEPGLESITNSATSQRGADYAQRKADEYRIHFTQKLMADASIAAGNNAVLMHTRNVNNIAASISVDPTFTNIDFGIKQLNDNSNIHRGYNGQGDPSEAISKIESGGNYDLVGKPSRTGDRAYGKYQVMGENVGPWTQKWYGQRLTPQQFLKDHDAQEAVFKGEFGSYVPTHGLSGAALKWFTGRGPSEGGLNAGPDAEGTTPSKYVDMFNKNLGSSTVSAAQDAKIQEMNEKDVENVVQYGAIAALRKSPDPVKTANDFIDYYGPKGLLKPPEADMLIKSAQVQARQNEAAAEAQERHEDRQAGIAASDWVNKKVGEVMQRGGPNAQDYKDLTEVLSDPQKRKGFDIKEGLARSLNEWLRTYDTKEAKIHNPEVYSSLYDGVLDGTKTIKDLMIANKPGGGLDDTHFNHLVTNMRLLGELGSSDPGFKAALTAAKASLVVPTNSADFEQEFLDKYTSLAPKDRAAALKFGDPNSLVSSVMKTHDPPQADKVQFKVLQNVGLGLSSKAATDILSAPDITGMTQGEARKKYGVGATVKLQGQIITIPAE